MTSQPVRELELMHLFGGDLALEQPRPLPPKVKLVGALMPGPAKPLPSELEVCVGAVLRQAAFPAHPYSHNLRHEVNLVMHVLRSLCLRT